MRSSEPGKHSPQTRESEPRPWRKGDTVQIIATTVAVATLSWQILMAVDTLSERFNAKYESLLERLSKVEAKVEMISINNPGKSK